MQKLGSLSIAQMQMVEIIKAVSCDARMIIMDESYFFFGQRRDRTI